MKELLEGLRIDKSRPIPQPVRTERNTLRWRRLAVGAIAAVAMTAGAWRFAAARAVKVEVITATATGANSPGAVLTAGGYVKAAKVVYVVPRVSGRISALRVAEGDEVKEGEVIATIDPRDLEQEAAEARAGMDLALANLNKLRAGSRAEEIAQARARVEALLAVKEREARDLSRSKALFDAGFISAQAFDKASTELEVGESEVAAARHALALVEAGPRKEEIQIAEASFAAASARWSGASNRLAYASIRAPATGRVLRKFADVGDFVSPGVPYIEGSDTLAAGSPVVSLADLGRQEVAADINETDIAAVRLHQPVEVTPDAYPGEALHGEVTQIAPRADKNKNTIEVKATIEKTDRVLPYDMSVKLAFLDGRPSGQRKPELKIPASAVVERNGRRFVFLASDSHAVRRAIEVGARDGEMVIVTSGIVDGDRVIVSNPEGLSDGKRIEFK